MNFLKKPLGITNEPALDYTMTNYTRFTFKDKKDLTINYNGRVSIFDELMFPESNKNNLRIAKVVDFNNNDMVAYALNDWNYELLDRIWHE